MIESQLSSGNHIIGSFPCWQSLCGGWEPSYSKGLRVIHLTIHWLNMPMEAPPSAQLLLCAVQRKYICVCQWFVHTQLWIQFVVHTRACTTIGTLMCAVSTTNIYLSEEANSSTSSCGEGCWCLGTILLLCMSDHAGYLCTVYTEAKLIFPNTVLSSCKCVAVDSIVSCPLSRLEMCVCVCCCCPSVNSLVLGVFQQWRV